LGTPGWQSADQVEEQHPELVQAWQHAGGVTESA
jgi:hypothetical protein